MKRVVMSAVAVVCIAAGTALATGGKDSEKDWCLLGISDKCAGSTTIDLVDKIKRLDIAIGKGSAVYTPEELEHLNKMLEEAHEIEDLLSTRH